MLYKESYQWYMQSYQWYLHNECCLKRGISAIYADYIQSYQWHMHNECCIKRVISGICRLYTELSVAYAYGMLSKESYWRYMQNCRLYTKLELWKAVTFWWFAFWFKTKHFLWWWCLPSHWIIIWLKEQTVIAAFNEKLSLCMYHDHLSILKAPNVLNHPCIA